MATGPNLTTVRTQTGHSLPAFVTADGRPRVLGCLPGPRSFRALAYSAANPVILRTEWAEYSRHRSDISILNQNTEGSCVAHGWTTMVERARAASGQSFRQLSRAFLYALVNGGRDAGANPADAAQALRDVGICTESTLPYSFIVERQLTAAMRSEAARFRLDSDSVYELSTFDELVSAELLGFKCGTTTYVAGDWNTLDADGCPPAYSGYSNHWVSADTGLKKSRRGNWLIPIINSWGTGWGLNGTCYFSEAHFANQQGLMMYAIRHPGQDPQDPDIGPVVA